MVGKQLWYPLCRALAAALLCGAALLLLSRLPPLQPAPTQAELEEARIFTTDDAQWFGDEPDFATEIRLLALATDEAGDYAELEIAGEVDDYRAGDTLVSPCVRLERFVKDGLLLDHCGAYTLLRLSAGDPERARFSAAPTLAVPPDSPPRLLDFRDDTDMARLARQYHQRLYEKPLSLRGQLKVDVRDSGGERQFFIFPGKDQRLFRQLPLQAGDQVVAINGIALGHGESLSDLYKRLADASHLAVTLERGGDELVLLLGF